LCGYLIVRIGKSISNSKSTQVNGTLYKILVLVFSDQAIKYILTGGLFFIILELNTGTVFPENDSPNTTKYDIRFDVHCELYTLTIEWIWLIFWKF